VQIEWSLFAVEDRTRIFDYIEQEDPLAADAVDERIMEQTATLSAFPECGEAGQG
jgi:toxin ParE1/3/4